MDYQAFLDSKTDLGTGYGFEPIEIPDFLFPFQRSLVDWSLRRGRSAILADCLSGESIINSPDGDIAIEEAYEQRKSIQVYAIDNGVIVTANATAPFINGVDRLYRFAFSSGREIIATMGHRFLTSCGWKRGYEIALGDSLAVSDACRLRSNSEFDLRSSREDGRRYSQITPNYLDRYSRDCHPCDGRLPLDLGIDRGSFPSPVDVREHIQRRFSMDDLESRSTRIRHCRVASHPSTVHSSHRVATIAEDVEFRLPSFFPSRDPWNNRIAQQVGEGTIPWQQVLESHPSGERLSESVRVACDDSPIEFDTLAAIDYIRTDAFYDIEVPRFSNYLANNIWSHNCGLGKGPMALVWSDNVVRQTNKPVLILTPLAVGSQMVREATKFGIDAEQSRTGSYQKKIVVTNYERLEHFKASDFGGVVCDESAVIKHQDSKTRAAVTEFMRTIHYRLLCTATPAPNDYHELGTSSEALGEMGFQDMITKFFKKEIAKGHLRWSREKLYLKGHAEHSFWRWVCSWARACRKPSDLGFDDTDYILPGLVTREHVVTARTKRDGFLFDLPAITLEDQREERRRTIQERCERVAELVSHDRPAIVWCHLNPEGDLAEKLIPNSVQVSGSDSDEAKEKAFDDFTSGNVRVIISKPKIAGYGLNWEHCAHQTFFPSHSFQEYYQSVRRSYRFGQKQVVNIDIVTTEGEVAVMANLQRKSDAADAMFSKLVALMHDHLDIKRTNPFTEQAEVPSWLLTEELVA